ncbi:hypothetical protein H0247_09120 [Pectobacterium sp. CFBP8739]|nr:hypothetical protein [Pectobacterium sp. CFBP8739]
MKTEEVIIGAIITHQLKMHGILPKKRRMVKLKVAVQLLYMPESRFMAENWRLAKSVGFTHRKMKMTMKRL